MSVKGSNKGGKKAPKKRHGVLFFLLIVLGSMGVLSLFNLENTNSIAYSDFKQLINDGTLKRIKITPTDIYGYTLTLEEERAQTTTQFNALIKPSQAKPIDVFKTTAINDPTLVPLLDEKQITYSAETPKDNSFATTVVIAICVIIVFSILTRSISKRLSGSSPMSFGQNKNKIIAESDLKTKFTDVAGCDESKEELAEIVDFLKNPAAYIAIGGKIPKGALLVGPPGTGKTLLARAVAGEAGTTFFKMSGADFVEMFVGVGAARVRDLFSQAREKSPCIIFIDEIDAIGKSRAHSISTNDEREQTLNQLLVEMDGFDSTTGVIVLAATNRPEILDNALLRAGRFDRQILVDRPDLHGREDILKIHSKNVKLAKDVDLHEVAVSTPGLVGSDLANIINEAALFAVRNKRKEVKQADLHEAIEKSAMGLAKRSRIMSRFEKENTAYHEIGHALVNVFTPDSNPLRKVSIIPRGFALGVTWSSPIEGRYSKTKEELISHIDMTLGGRAAEEIIYNRITTGATNDIGQATATAKSIIMEFGMSDSLKNIAFSVRQSSFMGGNSSREFSDATQNQIDNEIKELIASRYEHVINLLKRHKNLLISLTRTILETETLSGEEFINIVKQDEMGAKELIMVASKSLSAESLELSNFLKSEVFNSSPIVGSSSINSEPSITDTSEVKQENPNKTNI